MSNTQSAKKAVRQGEKRKTLNLRRTREMRILIKEVRELVAGNKQAEATKLLSKTYKAIDKAAKTGVIKSNTADRKKSRITRLVAKK